MSAAPLERLPLLDHLEPPLPNEIRDHNPFRILARNIATAAEEAQRAIDTAKELGIAEEAEDAAEVVRLDAMLDVYNLIVRRLPKGRAARVKAVAADLAESDAFWAVPPLERFPLVPTWMKGERIAALRGESLLEATRADYDPDGRIWASRTLGKKYGLTHGRIHQLLQAAKAAREANGLPA